MAEDPQASNRSLAEVCRQYGVIMLTQFGSEGAEGALNLLAGFEPGVSLAFSELIDLQEDLASTLHRRIFLVPQTTTGNPLRMPADTPTRIIFRA